MADGRRGREGPGFVHLLLFGCIESLPTLPTRCVDALNRFERRRLLDSKVFDSFWLCRGNPCVTVTPVGRKKGLVSLPH